jgi:hypothetical protein
MILIFAGWQGFMGKRALISSDVFKNRTLICSAVAMFMLSEYHVLSTVGVDQK